MLIGIIRLLTLLSLYIVAVAFADVVMAVVVEMLVMRRHCGRLVFCDSRGCCVIVGVGIVDALTVALAARAVAAFTMIVLRVLAAVLPVLIVTMMRILVRLF